MKMEMIEAEYKTYRDKANAMEQDLLDANDNLVSLLEGA
jgi:hypothetical protein